jgi:transposase
VGADETGLRQSGKSGWAWLFRTPTASLFEISPSRGGHVFEAALGRIDGVLVSDFYSVYTARKDIPHAYCGAHLIREAKEIAELDPSPVTREFSEKLTVLYKKGESATDFDTRESVRNTFRWMTMAPRFRKHPELARLGNRIDQNFEGIVAFLGRDDVPWNNNASERDIRPLAVMRKIVGSTRSENGSYALGHWMSVTQTLRKLGSHLADWLPDALCAWRNQAPTPTLFPTTPKN